MKRVGIVICDRYRSCAGGKCLRALRNREGAFSRYAGEEIELVGFTSCGGCPGGNIETAPEEMQKNGAEVVHLATGFVVGYPPCPHLEYFQEFLPGRFGLEVVIGTHPVPEKYFVRHEALRTWDDLFYRERISALLPDRETRLAYD